MNLIRQHYVHCASYIELFRPAKRRSRLALLLSEGTLKYSENENTTAGSSRAPAVLFEEDPIRRVVSSFPSAASQLALVRPSYYGDTVAQVDFPAASSWTLLAGSG